MQPAAFYGQIVLPALVLCREWTGVESPDSAHQSVMTIAGQEGGWQYRRQVPVAYARSFWQFEKAGGVFGLFATVPDKLKAVCDALNIPCDETTVFEAMAWNDTLACCMARLLLWTDPAPLPAASDVQGGWDYYQRNWRPGAPRPGDWPNNHAIAAAAIKEIHGV